MLTIKDLSVGDTTAITLLVKSASARKTKAGKDYLTLELFDGADTITGNYWDWLSGRTPQPNNVVDVTAQVTEWQGAKQLNISKLTLNNEVPVETFTPKSTYDVDQVYRDCYALASSISDDYLANLCVNILEALMSKWQTIPGALTVHHAYLGGTLIHSYSVARIASMAARVIPEANEDLCVAGALLHDVGKLYSYMLDKATISMTDEGKLYEHVFMGAEFVGNFSEEFELAKTEQDEHKLMILRHIILSHHGSLEYGAPVTPACIEAHIVHHADALDAACETIRAASLKAGEHMWTDRIWSIGNKPSLTTQYVERVMQPSMEKENDAATASN